jgi:hypothetical protein
MRRKDTRVFLKLIYSKWRPYPHVGFDGKQRRHGAIKKKVAGEHTVLGERRGLTKKTRILKDAAQNGGRWTLQDTWHRGEGSALKRKGLRNNAGHCASKKSVTPRLFKTRFDMYRPPKVGWHMVGCTKK